MTKVIDMEVGAPKTGRAKEIGEAIRDRPGTPFPESLDRPDGYGFDNYNHIFGGGDTGGTKDPGSLERTVAEMDASGVEFGLLTGAPNAEIGRRMGINQTTCSAHTSPVSTESPPISHCCAQNHRPPAGPAALLPFRGRCVSTKLGADDLRRCLAATPGAPPPSRTAPGTRQA